MNMCIATSSFQAAEPEQLPRMKKPAAAHVPTDDDEEDEEPELDESAAAEDPMQETRDRIKARKWKAVFDSLPDFVKDEFKKAPACTFI